MLGTMLRREAALRLDAATQREYAEVEAAGDDAVTWMEVTTALQRRVVAEWGFGGARARAALRALREIAPLRPDVAFWARHNRARRGDLAAGDVAPDAPLAPLESDSGGARSVRDAAPADGRPLGVVALSYS